MNYDDHCVDRTNSSSLLTLDIYLTYIYNYPETLLEKKLVVTLSSHRNFD